MQTLHPGKKSQQSNLQSLGDLLGTWGTSSFKAPVIKGIVSFCFSAVSQHSQDLSTAITYLQGVKTLVQSWTSFIAEAHSNFIQPSLQLCLC